MAEASNWIYISLFCLIFFKLIKTKASYYFPPPEKLRAQQRKVWLWENLLTSLVHSIISATLSVYSIYSTPSMINDMINTKNDLLYYTLAVSIGYFVYDFVDLAMNDLERSLCILLHHILVLSSFLVCVMGNKLLPFAIFALLVEVNSVFLHSRRLMKMSGFDQNGMAFKINRLLLLVTFILFRFFSCGWVTISLVRNRHDINIYSFAVGFCAMCIAILQNVFLLQQVLSSEAKDKMDHMKNGKSSKEKDHNANKSNSGNLEHILRVVNNCCTAE